MRPETEYAARTLADLILRDNGRLEDGPLAGIGTGEVTVEMRGMMQTIRRSLLIQHAGIANVIADEIERKAGEVNIAKTVGAIVDGEIERCKKDIENIVRTRVQSWIQGEIDRVFSEEYERIREIAHQQAKTSMRMVLENVLR